MGKDNVVVNFIILVLAVTAGQLLLKLFASYLPDNGIPGSAKHLIAGL